MINMNNNGQGQNLEDPANAKIGNDGQGDSSRAQNRNPHSAVLGKEAEASGARHTESEASRPDTAGSSSLDWSFLNAWEAGLSSAPKRVLEKRDHLWASDLYDAPINVWLKMRAEPYTNPPNTRSLMKFEAAHIVEYIIAQVLTRAGILKGSEIRAEYQYEGLLKVTGRMDHLAGGMPDYEQAKTRLEAMNLPEGFRLAMENTVKSLQEKYPNGLADKPIEIKSVSSFAMDAMERKTVSIKRHRVQLYHYLISYGYPKGILVYYCRDDARMIEFSISLDSPVREEYKSRIELLTKFHRETEPPPKEKMIVWDEDSGKFSKNFGVEYSPYLTKLYGFETPRDYSEIWAKKQTSWNRVLGRVKDGAKMTPKNEEVLEEIRTEGYNVEELVAQMPDKPVEEVTE